MAIRMGLIRKKADWTFEDFDSYWRESHSALARRAPNLREYWQNSVVDRLQRGIDFARGPWDFDGFSQLSFDDAEQSKHAFNDGGLAADLVRDEQHFLSDVHILTADREVVIQVPSKQERAKLLKRMSIIKRLPGMSEENFRREWKVHGDFVRKISGVSAYRQNIGVTRELVKGQRSSYEAFPIDGIVELWFKDVPTLEGAFNSPQGKETMAHAKTFLSEITAFVVAERQIL